MDQPIPDRRASVRELPNRFADGCPGAAAGCTVGGASTPGVTLRCLMYHFVYEQPELAKESFRALPAEARRLAGVDFSGANRACPHCVDVVSLMDRASKVLI